MSQMEQVNKEMRQKRQEKQFQKIRKRIGRIVASSKRQKLIIKNSKLCEGLKVETKEHYASDEIDPSVFDEYEDFGEYVFRNLEESGNVEFTNSIIQSINNLSESEKEWVLSNIEHGAREFMEKRDVSVRDAMLNNFDAERNYESVINCVSISP